MAAALDGAGPAGDRRRTPRWPSRCWPARPPRPSSPPPRRARRTARSARGRPPAGERAPGPARRSTCPTSSSRCSACLAASPGVVWSYEELHEAAWGTRYVGDRESVYSLVKRLRRKLAEAGVALDLVAVRGVGFQLVPQPAHAAARPDAVARWKGDPSRPDPPGSVHQQRDPHLAGVSEPCRPTSRVLVGEVDRARRSPVAAGGDHHVAEPRAAPTRATGAEPAARDRLVAGQHLGPVAEQLAPGAATSCTAPPRAVDVPEPRLATEQHHAVAQRRVVVEVEPAVVAASRPCRGRRPRPAGRAPGSASRSCSASASIIASCWSHWRRGDAVPVAGPVEVAVVEVGERGLGAAAATAPAIRSPTWSAPTYSAAALGGDGQPASRGTRAC